MDLYEHNTCSFIVKVWVEPNNDLMEHVRWRGHVTQVFTGQRQYFEDLAPLVNFITLYLERMGAKADQADRRGQVPLGHGSGAM